MAFGPDPTSHRKPARNGRSFLPPREKPLRLASADTYERRAIPTAISSLEPTLTAPVAYKHRFRETQPTP